MTRHRLTALLALAVTLSAAAAQAAMVTAQATGAFHDGVPGHSGRGTATIAAGEDGKLVLVLKDFATTPGPDLKVWLVKADLVDDGGDVTGNETLSLGPLASPAGDQTYAIPEGVAASDYGAVVIWCESFGVLFAAAELDPAG